MRILVDSHILVWWFENQGQLSKPQLRALRRASPAAPYLISDISLWEIAMLVAHRRLKLALPLRDWLERAAAVPLAERVAITPAIAAEVAALQDAMHGDPADRILVATARVHGATLLTRDDRLLSSGLVRTLG